ncbi:hypothetical protein [Clostridium sp.]
MKGGVRQRGLSWYYYFDLGIVDGKRKIRKKVAIFNLKHQHLCSFLRNGLKPMLNH